jgi:hypothetical protein
VSSKRIILPLKRLVILCGALFELLLGVVTRSLTLQVSYALLGIDDRAVGGPRRD